MKNEKLSKELKEQFQHPSRRYGIYPIVHGRIVPRAGKEESYKNFVKELEDRGFAGVVGNITYDENFPGDADEWARTEQGFRSFIKRGMKTWIYDEKGYPSGTAGGAVLDRHPEYCAQGLYCYEYGRTLIGPCKYRADVPGDRLFAAMLLPLDGGEAIDVTDMLDEKGTLRLTIPAGEYHLFTMSIRRLFDGTHAAESYSEPRNYISLSDKSATEEFIAVTHEKYAEHLSDEFGNGILAFFTDEPSLIAWNIRQGIYPIVPYHHTYPDEFMQRYGYPIQLAVVAVVTGRGPEKVKRRCDFWDYVADTVAENYFGTIQNWCREHRLKSSGHMLWEEDLQAHVMNYGSFFRSASRMDWPGIDQLDTEPRVLMDTKHGLPIARLLASFADLSGEGESFTECSDHCARVERNEQVGMNYIIASVNYHYAMGINNLTSYYNFENFSDEEIRTLNGYIARLGTLIRQGKRESRVALLYPEASIWSAYTPSIGNHAADPDENTRRIADCFSKTSWELLHRQIDFDYIDERILNEGKIENGKLCYKQRAYECVVFPEAQALREDSVQKILRLLDSDIGVVFVGSLPKFSRDSGKEDAFAEIFDAYRKHEKLTVISSAEGWVFPGRQKMPNVPRTFTLTPDRVEMVLTGYKNEGGWVDGELVCPWILSHTRVLEDGSKLIFIANMGCKKFVGNFDIPNGASAEIADVKDGSVTDAECSVKDGVLSVRITLRPYDGKFVHVMY